MSKPDFERAQYEEHVDRWRMIRDIVDARSLEDYLVKRNPQDGSPENATRNKQIFKRAVFSEIAGYTVNGFLGMLYRQSPKIDLPAQLEYAIEDITGSEISAEQFSQELTEELIKVGRAGVWIDFPPTDGDVSRQQIVDRVAVATATLFTAEQIINWRTTNVGARVKLQQVVIRTTDESVGEDGFTIESKDVLLELGLNEFGQYFTRMWRKDDKNEWMPYNPRFPTNGQGQALKSIPFVFAGSQVNNWRVDRAPMFSIAALNKAHFNNSAIYEDSVYQVGQAQPWMSGLDQTTLDLMAENNMYVGSGRLIGVPAGERFEFAQAAANPLAKEAMDDKVDQMVGLGAMFIQPGSAVKTATQAGGEQKVQHSVLSLIAENASEAMTQVLEWMGRFMNADSATLTFEINSNLVSPQADAQMLQQMVAGFIQGAIPMDAYLRWLQRHEIEDGEKTIEDFSAQVGGGGMPDLDNEVGT